MTPPCTELTEIGYDNLCEFAGWVGGVPDGSSVRDRAVSLLGSCAVIWFYNLSELAFEADKIYYIGLVRPTCPACAILKIL